MDDKKINLLPENLRFKEEKYKRPVLQFNPDFKLAGKKKKFKEPKLSGGEPSWLAKIFKKEKKHQTTPVVPPRPASLGSSISYNDTSSPVAPKMTAMEMRVPAKVEEHIQDFVPAQIKIVKIKGPSFWSKFAHKNKVVQPKQVEQKIGASALANGLKYNGNENTQVQPQVISKQVIPATPLAITNIPTFVPAQVKPAKIKGPSWWTRFLNMFKRQPKAKINKIDNSALSNGLQYNGNGNNQVQAEAKINIKIFQELNKQTEDIYTFNTKPKPVIPKTNEVIPATPLVKTNIPTFVPAQIKPVKVKGLSWWRRFLNMFKRQAKVKTSKIDNSALSNGLKYNGNGHSVPEAMYQPLVKPSVKVFQELNKPAEEAYNLSLKTKKTTNMITEMARPEPVEAEPVVQKFEQTVVPAQSKVVKPKKIKGPSLWSRFLAWLKRKFKNKKSNNSVLNNDLKDNGKEVNIPEPVLVMQESNKPTAVVENFESKPSTGFDLTEKVNEEIGLTPSQSIDSAPEAVKLEMQSLTNDFTMPAFIPKTEIKMPVPVEMAPTTKPAEVPAPKANDSRFHMPELSQNNSLMTGSVDLIPIAARVRSWKQIMTLLLFSVILSVVILGLLYGYVVYEMQRIIAKDMERRQMISEVDKKILAFSKLNKDISVLGQEIQLVQDTLNKHIYWTNFFALLEKYTVSDVYYSGLAMGTNGGLTLSATTKSYDSVAKQLKIFESADAAEFVTDASITSARQDKDGSVSFQVILNLNQSLFYYRQTK